MQHAASNGSRGSLTEMFSAERRARMSGSQLPKKRRVVDGRSRLLQKSNAHQSKLPQVLFESEYIIIATLAVYLRDLRFCRPETKQEVSSADVAVVDDARRARRLIFCGKKTGKETNLFSKYGTDDPKQDLVVRWAFSLKFATLCCICFPNAHH